jgi:hypothetical protein
MKFRLRLTQGWDAGKVLPCKQLLSELALLCRAAGHNVYEIQFDANHSNNRHLIRNPVMKASLISQELKLSISKMRGMQRSTVYKNSYSNESIIKKQKWNITL